MGNPQQKAPTQPPTEQRLHTLELVVSEMDAQMHQLHAMVQLLSQRGEEMQTEQANSRGTPMRDDVWVCSNCSARLGIYNQEREELRVRYKDFVAYVKPGVGGRIMVPCRRCGEQNTLDDTRRG